MKIFHSHYYSRYQKVLHNIILNGNIAHYCLIINEIYQFSRAFKYLFEIIIISQYVLLK